ncbi:CsgE family curli-type amyloid fiber assembly protein [Myroides sp. LJL116]
MKKNIVIRQISLLLFIIMFSSVSYSQILNTKIQAELNIQYFEDNMLVTAQAFNKTDQTKSLSAVFSIIKSSDSLANQALEKREGRFVVQEFQTITLFEEYVELNQKESLTLLLLLYDTNSDLVGMKRLALNEQIDSLRIKEAFSEQLAMYSSQVSSPPEYKIVHLENIVIDQTKTKAGRDFYQLFYSQFIATNIKTNAIIKITETWSMGSSTILRVYADNQLLFEFFVRSQYDFIREMVKVALARVQRYIALENQKEKRLKIY